MGIKCLFGHDWKVYNILNYNDTSHGLRMDSHVISYLCKRCKESKKQIMYACGHLTNEKIDFIKDK
jgi:hypothetical protein